MPTATDDIDVAKGERTAAATATIATRNATRNPREIVVGALGFLDWGRAVVSSSGSSASGSASTTGAGSGAANGPPRSSTACAPVVIDGACAVFDRVLRAGR